MNTTEPEPLAAVPLPLCLIDQRFVGLRALLSREIRKRFAKLFKTSHIAGQRSAPNELVAFLVYFVYFELKEISGMLEGQGDDPIDVFKVLFGGLTEGTEGEGEAHGSGKDAGTAQ